MAELLGETVIYTNRDGTSSVAFVMAVRAGGRADLAVLPPWAFTLSKYEDVPRGDGEPGTWRFRRQ